VRTVAILPTLITLGNAVCGFMAITYIAKGMGLKAAFPAAAGAEFEKAAYLILVAMIFDALDGRVARMTRTASSFGTQLDSLCDFLTFGTVPAFLTYGLCWESSSFPPLVVLGVCVIYVCFAATRLARFNVETGTDERHHREFTGLPSPAAAGVIASTIIPWAAIEGKWALAETLNKILQAGLPVTVFLLAVLMVSRIPYPHLVNKLLRGPRPFVTFVELAVVALLAVIFHEFALFLGFMGYAIIGPALWIRGRVLRRPVPGPGGAPEPPTEDSLF
jgi:CDP-diacylglycerol--serine O-phosphatidyltransferase